MMEGRAEVGPGQEAGQRRAGRKENDREMKRGKMAG